MKLRTSTGEQPSRAFLENEILVLRQHRDRLSATATENEAAALRWRGEAVALTNRAADAEHLADRWKKDLDGVLRQLTDANARLSDLHAKLRERENAIVALGIRLGEMKLNESYGGTGR